MTRQSIRQRVAWTVTIGLILIALAATFWLAFIGAFDNRLYHDVPATGPAAHARPNIAAVLLSGDMGFRIGMGPDLASRIAGAGIPVTGVSSLTYFRKRRSPDQIRTFVEKAMAHARTSTGARRLVLIGQSFGADMLHVGLSQMSAAEKRDIVLVAFVVPTDTVYYQISLGETLEWNVPDAQAIDTARGLDWVPAICIQGQEERNSLCPHLTQPNMWRVALPGGHPLHRDADAVAKVLLQAIHSASGRKPPPQG
ncbi:MAG TPA: AcvB/VirJ family lysyl-phosphatidylglycerol hydrolase [Sphingobium sp.]|uniref:AcvB/VirJ family lysyl-phosphatidylglycerol hydrolase n=1 Tax=Sphingobium sp. TaxID=1912891 RepID=UPI002ECFDBB9